MRRSRDPEVIGGGMNRNVVSILAVIGQIVTAVCGTVAVSYSAKTEVAVMKNDIDFLKRGYWSINGKLDQIIRNKE